MKVKIFGAGSIGNHLAQASRRMGWDVTVVDVDSEALKRMKESIYPTRYGKWDEAIKLSLVKDAPVGGFDAVFIGTPPDVRMKIVEQVIAEDKPRLILLEKPPFPPFIEGVNDLVEVAQKNNVMLCVGYDHVLGKNTEEAEKLIKNGVLGQIQTLDVEFREHWGGIFNAHPWLAGPHESYLGFWEKGGGASGEHSHAANLWQHFAHKLGLGRAIEVSAMMDFVDDKQVNYDRLCVLHLKTEKGIVGRVVQDVITKPTKKWSRLQGDKGFIEWYSGYAKDTDLVKYSDDKGEVKEISITKKRPDDFFAEVTHIDKLLKGEISSADSPISFARGFDTWLVICAAHTSVREKRTVGIDYANGYSEKALKF
jgi:predicted dehydrogenase